MEGVVESYASNATRLGISDSPVMFITKVCEAKRVKAADTAAMEKLKSAILLDEARHKGFLRRIERLRGEESRLEGVNRADLQQFDERIEKWRSETLYKIILDGVDRKQTVEVTRSERNMFLQRYCASKDMIAEDYNAIDAIQINEAPSAVGREELQRLEDERNGAKLVGIQLIQAKQAEIEGVQTQADGVSAAIAESKAQLEALLEQRKARFGKLLQDNADQIGLWQDRAAVYRQAALDETAWYEEKDSDLIAGDGAGDRPQNIQSKLESLAGRLNKLVGAFSELKLEFGKCSRGFTDTGLAELEKVESVLALLVSWVAEIKEELAQCLAFSARAVTSKLAVLKGKFIEIRASVKQSFEERRSFLAAHEGSVNTFVSSADSIISMIRDALAEVDVDGSPDVHSKLASARLLLCGRLDQDLDCMSRSCDELLSVIMPQAPPPA